MKLASCFVIGFCSLFLLFVGLDPAQDTKYSNAIEQLASQNIWTNTLVKTVSTFTVRPTKDKASLYTPFEISRASQPDNS